MSETKVTAATMTKGTETVEEKNGRERDPLSGKVYTTYEECEKHKPQSAKADAWKVFDVTKPDGTVVYTWGFTGINAVNNVARVDGYEASAHGGRTRKPVDKTAVIKDAYAHFTEAQLREVFSTPVVEAILAERKAQAEKSSAHPANKGVVEANKAKPAGKKS